MNRQRLRTLSKFLRGGRVRQFSMEAFFHDCGTPSCMAGWATEIPAFRDAGLSRYYYRGTAVPMYGGRFFGFAALRRFFDLSDAQCDYLFDSAGLSRVAPRHRDVWTPHEGADHIDDFLLNGIYREED